MTADGCWAPALDCGRSFSASPMLIVPCERSSVPVTVVTGTADSRFGLGILAPVTVVSLPTGADAGGGGGGGGGGAIIGDGGGPDRSGCLGRFPLSSTA